MASPNDIAKVSTYSVLCGNIPLVEDQAVASVLKDGDDLVGFAAAQVAIHAAGSYIDPRFRGRGLTYGLRSQLEATLKKYGFRMYFAIPGNDFEKMLFAKYGPVQEGIVQIKDL